MTPDEVTKPEAEAGDEDDTDDVSVDLMVLGRTKSKEMEEPVNSKPMVELERRILDVEPRLPSVARSGTHWAQVYENRGELACSVQLHVTPEEERSYSPRGDVDLHLQAYRVEGCFRFLTISARERGV
jgi:hypothetical protein